MKLEHEKGETLQNLSEADLVLYHSYGNILSIETVQASYKDTVRVKNNKFRRKDGMQIPRNDYVWIMQYDHIAYQAYLAKRYTISRGML